jgi:dTMP kinase
VSSGFYCVIEGIEGAGKTTVTAKVAERLAGLMSGRTILPTRHPGATPLGKHLRTLLKYSWQIDPAIELDALSSQLLMVVDNSCFVSTVLLPALERGEVVLADRSNFISSIAYGVADGLQYGQIDQMFRVAKPPHMDRLYVLRLPWEIARERMMAQGGGDKGGLDRFEQKGEAFFRRVQSVYNGLVTGPQELLMVVNHSVRLENIKYVDATQPIDMVVNEIVRDICRLEEEA